MRDVYRKWGRAVHYEHGQIVLVSEAGKAVEDGELFASEPLLERMELEDIDAEEVERVAREVERLIREPLRIERLIVSHGVARHDLNGTEWSDETRRVHLAIASPSGLRALVDRGDFELGDIVRVSAALARAGAERDEPPRVRLAPNVTAALLPMLEGVTPPNVELWQAAGGVDGKGQPIVSCHLQSPPWPNWYRPSYRVRPVRMPMNVRLTCAVDVIDRDVPEAVAILEPVSGLVLRVLVEDRGTVHPATIRVSRIDAVGEETSWYPYGAGVFGAEVML